MISILKNSSKIYFSSVFIFLTGIFLFHYLFSGQAVYGDGIGYYSYMHSWYFDFDNNFTNEYKHIYGHENNNSLLPKHSNAVQIVRTNNQGKALNHFSPGMAILLMPFYILADLIVVISNALGINLVRNGYSDIYQIICGLGAITYVTLTLWMSEKLLKIFKFKISIQRLAVLTLFFATNLLYYGAFDVLNSHFASFFLSTLFFLYFFEHRKKLTIRNYFLLGLITGLIAVTRPQDGIIAIVIIIDALVSLKAKHNVLFWKAQFVQTLKNLLSFTLPLVVIISPLIIQWITTFDTLDSHPYFLWITARNDFNLVFNIFGTLFHPTNGLFSRTPIILLCALMLWQLTVNKKLSYSLKLFSIFFFFEFLLIVIQEGWKAAAYGGRMYISLSPFFLVLIAKLLQWIELKYSNSAKWLFIIIFISINILSMFSFILFEKEASDNHRGTEKYTFERIIKFIK